MSVCLLGKCGCLRAKCNPKLKQHEGNGKDYDTSSPAGYAGNSINNEILKHQEEI